ncbi:C-type lectin domain family 12 member B [Dissostichus eleginoides]|uniref:C-type lectin domain family 12 member B n=1 Tax=Dissostichus eleginoides TaxID=100907 RepID=A0AAD9FDY0_DISEL|nr:C-type lectin domain family 12 member B [Dissostichus eleginoides]
MGLRIYLTSELSGNNAELYSRIQELETRENNLTQQIQDMTTNWNELNVSRAQWSIDSYCLGNTVTSELSEDNAKQTAEILNLTSRIQELETWKNLTVRWDNLTQAFTVLESNVKNLNKLNQELETKKNNLTQQKLNMETNWNELNISRAQWSIDSYCLGNTDDKCQPCQFGWFLSQPSCYAINDPPSPGWKTWEEAREECKGKNSDLAVAQEITEEADYVNAPEGPADKKATRPEDTKKEAAGTVDTKASPPVTSELSEDNAKQTAEILNLTSRIQELETRENLTVSCDNLTQAYTVSESNVKDLNAEIKTLTTQKDGLTKQIQEMEKLE